ncbi:gp2 [Rhabdoviridae sp.]|uniref:Gp2 n=1 Tax=Hubei tick rhabdovirus 1 TaxID=3071239 RepID=A0AA49B2P5_9RHAB|nr:gp2 [Rhabdoviridae sp.]UGM45842.1 gp2 [Rhabdoviridae sp.]UGM46135.1 gp2 [Hubei tick rhabdovirus 1]UGM46143.1 gp2 [Rhabdoviridae sp.]
MYACSNTHEKNQQLSTMSGPNPTPKGPSGVGARTSGLRGPSGTRELGVLDIGAKAKALGQMTTFLQEQIEAEGDDLSGFEDEEVQETVPHYTCPGPELETVSLPPPEEPSISIELDPAKGDVNYMFDKLKEVVNQLEVQGVLLPSEPVLVDRTAIIKYTCVPRVLSVSTADDRSSVNSEPTQPVLAASKEPPATDPTLLQEVESVFTPVSLRNLMGRPVLISLREQEVSREDVLKALKKGREDGTGIDPKSSVEKKVYLLLDLSEKGKRSKRILQAPPS